MAKDRPGGSYGCFGILRITYITTGLDVAGAETQVRDLALALRARGHDVSVISLTTPLAYSEHLRSAGVPVVDLGVQRQDQTWSAAVRAILQLRRKLRQKKTDIIHSHMVHANILSRLASIGLSCPLICTAHNIHEGGRARDLAYRLTEPLSTLNTTISSAATERFVADRVFQKRKTITIYNGIDVSKFRPDFACKASRKNSFRWVAIGRLQQQKDYPTLLKSLAKLTDHSLDIFGKGELQPELEKLANELGIAERVRFMGVTEDVPQSLRQYDAFVLSSAWEGFGLVVAEAMASGLPVVATRSGGPEEIIGLDNTAGFLAPVGSPEALAEAMSKLAALSPEKRREMGEAGRQRILDKFSMGAIVDRWEGIYQALVQGRAVS